MKKLTVSLLVALSFASPLCAVSPQELDYLKQIKEKNKKVAQQFVGNIVTATKEHLQGEQSGVVANTPLELFIKAGIKSDSATQAWCGECSQKLSALLRMAEKELQQLYNSGDVLDQNKAQSVAIESGLKFKEKVLEFFFECGEPFVDSLNGAGKEAEDQLGRMAVLMVKSWVNGFGNNVDTFRDQINSDQKSQDSDVK